MDTYDLFKVVEVSVISEIIVAISILSAVKQYNYYWQVLKIPTSGTSLMCGEKGYGILYHTTKSPSWGQLLYIFDKETLMPC